MSIRQRISQTVEALRDHKGQYGLYCSNPEERLSHGQLVAINDAIDALKIVLESDIDVNRHPDCACKGSEGQCGVCVALADESTLVH